MISAIAADNAQNLGNVQTSDETTIEGRLSVERYCPEGYEREQDKCVSVGTDRFGLQTTYSSFNLANYGCWCRGGAWVHGKGQAVDIFDELCRQQHHNYDCLALEDSTCDPNTVLYSYDIFMVGTDVMVECSNDPVTESCQAKTCMIDLQVISKYVKELNQYSFPDVRQFGHGVFDPEVECPRGTPSDREKVCCGSFPFREWYLKNGDVDFRNRECCEYDDAQVAADWGAGTQKGRYYDSSIETCCSDGSGVSVIGGRC